MILLINKDIVSKDHSVLFIMVMRIMDNALIGLRMPLDESRNKNQILIEDVLIVL